MQCIIYTNIHVRYITIYRIFLMDKTIVTDTDTANILVIPLIKTTRDYNY